MSLTKWLGAGALGLISSCGPGGGGAAVRPADPTYGGASGEAKGDPASCHAVGEKGQPLLVDWEAEDRVDLEAAMRKGVAVVHYDCSSLKVLPDCHVDGGQYGFTGTSMQEKTLELRNADEVQGNLPLYGAKLGAKLARGTSLEVTLMIVGKTASTSDGVDRARLKGKCDGATHFVRGAWVGAFAMKTGATGEVSGGAQFAGAGVSGESTSQKATGNKSGDVAACQAADPDGPKPPSKCAAALRMDLLAISESADKADEKKDDKKGLVCPKGLVAVEDRCAQPAPNVAHACEPLDGADCVKQCDAGDMTSCSYAAFMYDLGVDLPQDYVKEKAVLEKGCNDKRVDTLGVKASMCSSLAGLYFSGNGVTADTNKARALEEKACYLGDVGSCGHLGYELVNGLFGAPTDPAKGARMLTRACNGGEGISCEKLGQLYRKGNGPVAADKPRAVGILQLACDGGYWGCLTLGEMYETGDGVPVDAARALKLYERTCKKKDQNGCRKAKALSGK